MSEDRHLSENELHDYAEGLLPPAAARALEPHLAACDRCAAEVAALKDVIVGLAELPREIAPGADLRPGIRRGVRQAAARRDRRRALRSLRWPLAAVAAMLVVATAAVTALLVDRGPASPAGAPPAGQHTLAPRSEARVPAAFRAADAEYQRTAAELTRALERQREALSPETVRLVEENLRAVEGALREARQALAADSTSPVIREIVLASHEKRIDVLRWATSIAGET